MLLVAGVLAGSPFGLGCHGTASTDGHTSAAGGECRSCHMPDYTHANHPVHVGTKPTTCAVCHSQDSWRPSVVRHDWWPLTGAHSKAECSYCHDGTPVVFKGTPRECVGCHRKDYDASKFPGHSRFATTCADCHSTSAWKPASGPLSEQAEPELKPTKIPSAPPKVSRPSQSPRKPTPDVTTHPSPQR